MLSGLALVVTPLLSLMKDQLEHLPQCIPAAIWSSMQSIEEIDLLITDLRSGALKVYPSQMLLVKLVFLLSHRFCLYLRSVCTLKDSRELCFLYPGLVLRSFALTKRIGRCTLLLLFFKLTHFFDC